MRHGANDPVQFGAQPLSVLRTGAGAIPIEEERGGATHRFSTSKHDRWDWYESDINDLMPDVIVVPTLHLWHVEEIVAGEEEVAGVADDNVYPSAHGGGVFGVMIGGFGYTGRWRGAESFKFLDGSSLVELSANCRVEKQDDMAYHEIRLKDI